MTRAFWKAVALFAYRRWRRPQDKMPDGVPGNRSPDSVCTAYDPGPRDGFECQSDGHYLCRGCSHYRPPAYYCPESPHYLDRNAPYGAGRA